MMAPNDRDNERRDPVATGVVDEEHLDDEIAYEAGLEFPAFEEELELELGAAISKPAIGDVVPNERSPVLSDVRREHEPDQPPRASAPADDWPRLFADSELANADDEGGDGEVDIDDNDDPDATSEGDAEQRGGDHARPPRSAVFGGRSRPAAPETVAVRTLRLFEESDEPWITALLELVERSIGEPWRLLHERAERGLALGPTRAPRTDVQAILVALEKTMGGRAERTRVARDLRGRVLGLPALDAEARRRRIEAVAQETGIDPSDVENLLWADLARERPITLPRGKPEALTLAALANLDRMQAAVRRAQEIRIELRDDANELVRMASRYGLLSTTKGTSITPQGVGTTVLQVAGPLSLFHATAVYGRALSALVPLLAEHAWLSLEIVEPPRGTSQRLRSSYILPPVLLPPVPTLRRRRPTVGERLARALLDAGLSVVREPPPLVSGQDLLFPDLALVDLRRGERWFVEIVGFSTSDYLLHKLAAYERGGHANVLLCVDSERSPTVVSGPQILPFRREVDVRALAETMTSTARERFRPRPHRPRGDRS